MPPARNPIFCYVTNQRLLGGDRSLSHTICQAAAAGVSWIQVREKALPGRALIELTRQALIDAQKSGARIVVNDRLDVAVAAGAGGVHLGETSLPAEAVVQWRHESGNVDFLVGSSCHSLEAGRSAERAGVDYIFFGPVFETPSKAEFGPPQGLDLLRELCVAVRIPVLAIGGITAENAGSCILAGAAGIAAIRMFQESNDVAGVVARLRTACA